MKHIQEVKVYYEETDCYGVVWHGSYIKWLEIGRVELANLLGIEFGSLNSRDIQMPVVDLNLRYKSPAKIMDELTIETIIEGLKKTSITFGHKIVNKNNGQIILAATSTVVTTTKEGKLYRKIPEFLFQKFERAAVISV